MAASTPRTLRFAYGCSSMSFASMPIYEIEFASDTSLRREIACNDSQLILILGYSLVMIEPRQVAFFRAKLLRPGGTSSDAPLAVGVLAGSLPQFLSKKLGIPSAPSDCTLALSLPIGRSCELARKTASPAGEAQLSFTKGKRIRTQTFQYF